MDTETFKRASPQEQLQEYLRRQAAFEEVERVLQDRAHAIAQEYLHLKGRPTSGATLTDFSIGPEECWFIFTEWYGCDRDETSMSFPTKWLWQEDWQEQAKSRIEAEKKRKAEEEAAKRKADLEREIDQKLGELERLREKYAKVG